MYEIPIDEVHRLLQLADDLISRLDGSRDQSIEIVHLPELVELVYELEGSPLGINGALLNKIKKVRGTIKMDDLYKVTDRIRAFLRSEDQAFEWDLRKKKDPQRPTSKKTNEERAIIIEGETWVNIKISSEIKQKITVLSSLLDSIIEQTARANEPSDEQLLTPIERQQLIAILETTLSILKSPMVEKGLLKKAREMLQKGTESTAEKGVQQGLGKLMEVAGQRIIEIMGMLF